MIKENNIIILQGILEYLENDLQIGKDFARVAICTAIFANGNNFPVVPNPKQEEILKAYDTGKNMLEFSEFSEFKEEFYTVYKFYQFVIQNTDKNKDAQVIFLHALKVAASLKWSENHV